MKETYTTLQTMCQDYSGDTSATSLAFFKREINRTVRFLYTYFKEYIQEKQVTTTTVAGQQGYYKPIDCYKIEGVKVTTGNITPPLLPIDSEYEWDRLTSVPIRTPYPRYFRERQRDYYIWPAPSSALTLTLTYLYRVKDMSAEDYTSGTVTVTNGSPTVTGSGTTWTSLFTGRYFEGPDGYFYRILSRDSNTQVTLETNYAGVSGTGQSYRIAECPDLPDELHELIPARVMQRYMLKQKDEQEAAIWDNVFYTGDAGNQSRDPNKAAGGIVGIKQAYMTNSNVGVVSLRPRAYSPNTWRWSLRINS